jgi:hypothetical protein
MAQFTLKELKDAVGTYVDATKQLSATYTPTIDDFTKTVCKIGDMFTLYLPHVDKLPELSGENLPFGETVEEFMTNDMLPTDQIYEDQATRKNAKRVTFDEAVYSYPLKEQKFELGVPRVQFQRVALGAESMGNLVASSLQTLDSSTNAWNYAAKRQLLGNMAKAAAKASNSANLVKPVAIPVDSATGEAFIKEVKKAVEDAEDANDCNLAGHVTAAAPSLKLYIRKGVMPSLDVDTSAGCYHLDKIAIPAETKVILDFGDADSSIYAILVDPRAIKLRDDFNYVDSDYDGSMSQENFWRHLKQTGVISKYGFIRVFKNK